MSSLGPCPKFSALAKKAEGLTSSGELEEAERLYTRYIEQGGDLFKSNSNLALARNNRGHIKYLKVDFYGAIKDYTDALELDPNLAVAYYNRGQIHYRMGRFSMAIEDLRKAVDLDPSFEDASKNLSQAEKDFAAKVKERNGTLWTT